MSTHIRSAVLAAALVAAATPAVSQDTTAARQDTSARPGTHTVVKGDNLWALSQQYLGNPFLWPELYRLNRDVVEDPHWIYPGEVLRLPGAEPTIAQANPQVPAPVTPAPGDTSAPVVAQPPIEQELTTTLFPKAQPAGAAGGRATGGQTFSTAGYEVPVAPPPTVRAGEAITAPYVDREGGPRSHGRIIKSGDLAGIAQASDRFKFQAYDRVMIEPPPAQVAPEGERYMAYKLGPIIEDMGQIVIPTGVVEVVQAPRAGAPAIAKVVRAYNELSSTDLLVPLDTAGIGRSDKPVKVDNGPEAKVMWVIDEPVLASLQNYVIVDLTSKQGVKPGDQMLLYRPRPKKEDFEPQDPPVPVGKAQVVRVTAYGATAIIIGQEQPQIQEGMPARIIARMP